jgi:predicted NBD/HSP70 family sugar kinase
MFTGSRTTASNRTPREINTRCILDLIRCHQPVSRADLSRLSGLQRSTVSLVVTGLMDHHVISEGSKRAQKGRSPTLIHLNPNRFIIAVDVRYANTTLALVDRTGHVSMVKKVRRLANVNNVAVAEMVSDIEAIISENRARAIDGVGILLPHESKVISEDLNSEIEKALSDHSIESQVRQATGLSVRASLVAKACALSEKWFSKLNGREDLVVIDVSQCVTVGIIANEEPLCGANGRAGLIGGLDMTPRLNPRSCGGKMLWGATASNHATMRYYNSLNPENHIEVFEALLKRREEGDPIAYKAINRMATRLGAVVRTLALLLDPDEIIITGEITDIWDSISSLVEAGLRQCFSTGTPSLRAIHNDSAQRLRSAVALLEQANSGENNERLPCTIRSCGPT